MKVIQHIDNKMSTRLYRILRFFHLTPDYMVETEKTLSLTLWHNGVTMTIPLIKDANIMDLAGKWVWRPARSSAAIPGRHIHFSASMKALYTVA